LLKLGFLSAILSPIVTDPFSIACYLQSICSQLPSMFGIQTPLRFGYAKVFLVSKPSLESVQKVIRSLMFLSFLRIHKCDPVFGGCLRLLVKDFSIAGHSIFLFQFRQHKWLGDSHLNWLRCNSVGFSAVLAAADISAI
jgi:hypothetical protein